MTVGTDVHILGVVVFESKSGSGQLVQVSDQAAARRPDYENSTVLVQCSSPSRVRRRYSSGLTDFNYLLFDLKRPGKEPGRTGGNQLCLFRMKHSGIGIPGRYECAFVIAFEVPNPDPIGGSGD
ncbi:MAG: hypothetical protein L0Z50_05685 [Verrucomicrobiales bacterium]|nr:hypothetical protein [Verrucomicrobiales bacterium]